LDDCPGAGKGDGFRIVPVREKGGGFRMVPVREKGVRFGFAPVREWKANIRPGMSAGAGAERVET